MFELNTNLSQIPLGFSIWSGYQNPLFPNTNINYFDTKFDNIIYRDNNYSGLNYSYIMDGQYLTTANNNSELSFISEFYPQTSPNSHICQENFLDTYEDINVFNEDRIEPSTMEGFENLLSYLENESITVSYDSICESPHYYDANQSYNKKVIAKFNQQNLIINNGIIILDDNYKQAVCKVYSMEGKLILTKQIGMSSISTQNLKPGMYILQAINSVNLKAKKFIIYR